MKHQFRSKISLLEKLNGGFLKLQSNFGYPRALDERPRCRPISIHPCSQLARWALAELRNLMIIIHNKKRILIFTLTIFAVRSVAPRTAAKKSNLLFYIFFMFNLTNTTRFNIIQHIPKI